MLEMDKETYTLLDYVVYRMYLNEVNANNKPVWKEAYRFTKFYQVPNMEYGNYLTIMKRMNSNNTFFEQMMNYLWAEGPLGKELIQNQNGNCIILNFFRSITLHELSLLV